MYYMIFTLLFKDILEHFFVIACSKKIPGAIPGSMNVWKYLILYDSFVRTIIKNSKIQESKIY